MTTEPLYCPNCSRDDRLTTHDGWHGKAYGIEVGCHRCDLYVFNKIRGKATEDDVKEATILLWNSLPREKERKEPIVTRNTVKEFLKQNFEYSAKLYEGKNAFEVYRVIPGEWPRGKETIAEAPTLKELDSKLREIVAERAAATRTP